MQVRIGRPPLAAMLSAAALGLILKLTTKKGIMKMIKNEAKNQAIPSAAETAQQLQIMIDGSWERLHTLKADLENRISALDAALPALKDTICRAILRGQGIDEAGAAYNANLEERRAKETMLELLAEKGCEDILDGWTKQRQALMLMAGEGFKPQTTVDPAQLKEWEFQRSAMLY